LVVEWTMRVLGLTASLSLALVSGCGSPPADDSDPTVNDVADSAAADCNAAGGLCASVAFVSSPEEACGGETPLSTSCGDHTFRVCCPQRLTAIKGIPKTVNEKMPSAATKFIDANDMGDHHLGWHMSRQWDRLDASDRDWLTKQGWSRADAQEGDPGNGLEFLAMHRFVLNTMRALPELASQVALFDGWTRVPDPEDGDVASSGADSIAQNPLAPGADADIPAAFRTAIARCQDPAERLKQFASDDDLGRFLETQANQAGVSGAGVHNYLHNRFSQPGSSVDLGDPQKNFKNQVFWRLHGWIDRCWSTYRTAMNKKDDDPDYVAALAKGAAEMHLAQGSK
jgi:hypothetical protein